MKTAQQIEPTLPAALTALLEFDKREIDNPDAHHHARLNYLDRLRKILSLIRSRFPHPAGVSAADIGCGQGNVSLLLAEQGYQVTAVDISPAYLEYARRKQERGSIQWVQGSFDQLELKQAFDVMLLGELIEHCAYPEDFMLKAAGYLKPSGLLLVTTPNASMFRNRLPTFGRLRRREDRAFLEARQFGPDGSDHLFLFTRGDLRLIVPPGFRLEADGYLGGSVLINRRTAKLLRWLPSKWVEGLERLIAHTPLLNHYTCHGLYAVLRKPPAATQ